METYGLQKITLLREISLKTGIQVGPPFQLELQGEGSFLEMVVAAHVMVDWELLFLCHWLRLWVLGPVPRFC